MDAPLILTTKIVPSEIDKEALNVEIVDHYPLEFYELTQGIEDEDGDLVPPPAKAAIEAGVTIVESVLGTDLQYVGQKFTHDTHEIVAKGQPTTLTTPWTLCDRKPWLNLL